MGTSITSSRHRKKNTNLRQLINEKKVKIHASVGRNQNTSFAKTTTLHNMKAQNWRRVHELDDQTAAANFIANHHAKRTGAFSPSNMMPSTQATPIS